MSEKSTVTIFLVSALHEGFIDRCECTFEVKPGCYISGLASPATELTTFPNNKRDPKAEEIQTLLKQYKSWEIPERPEDVHTVFCLKGGMFPVCIYPEDGFLDVIERDGRRFTCYKASVFDFINSKTEDFLKQKVIDRVKDMGYYREYTHVQQYFESCSLFSDSLYEEYFSIPTISNNGCLLWDGLPEKMIGVKGLFLDLSDITTMTKYFDTNFNKKLSNLSYRRLPIYIRTGDSVRFWFISKFGSNSFIEINSLHMWGAVTMGALIPTGACVVLPEGFYGALSIFNKVEFTFTMRKYPVILATSQSTWQGIEKIDSSKQYEKDWSKVPEQDIITVEFIHGTPRGFIFRRHGKMKQLSFEDIVPLQTGDKEVDNLSRTKEFGELVQRAESLYLKNELSKESKVYQAVNEIIVKTVNAL